MTSIRELAAQTPAHRERYIDLLRSVAIMAVVVGHWLVIAVEYDRQGGLTGFSVLGVLTWSHPLTWLFQVMPVFFLVGGFANAASLAAHQRDGGQAAGWLLARSARLVRPTTVLLVAMAGTALLTRLLGAEPDQVAMAVWLVSIPLWFLVVYLAMIALTPVMYPLHQRAGLAVPVLLLVPVVIGDLLRFHYGTEEPAYGNFLFAWLAIHQLGFAWRDGQLPNRPRVSVPLLAGGLGALLLLTVAGPYPTSMVTVPGETVQNSSPPTMALVALAATQFGLALLLRRRCEQWLQRLRPWTVVVAINAVILTMFLWHMAAVVVTALALDAAGLLPTPAVDSTDWLLWQIPWVVILAVVLAGLVATFGRIEAGASGAQVGHRLIPATVAEWVTHLPGRFAPQPLLVSTVAGYAAALTGLLWVAAAGPSDHGPFALPTGALLLYLAGAALLWLGRAADSRSAS